MIPPGGGGRDPAESQTGYAFLDCGHGRRLERFAGIAVSRPAPAASWPPILPPAVWAAAQLSFCRGSGWLGVPPADWRIRLGSVSLGLRPTGGGQLGFFPECLRVAGRLSDQLAERPVSSNGRRIINLFAHTGLVTLALASLPGVREIIHVDSSPGALRQARENAVLSGLEKAPVRWLADDALAFLVREVRRDRDCDLLVADPPAYGRGGGTGDWKLERDLPELLRLAGILLARQGGLLCLVCHRAGWGASDLLRQAAAIPGLAEVETLPLVLRTTGGARKLALGTALFAALPRKD
ncbi:MAG: class I SAM-dependent methyltransferase [Planctomycetota bacterium]|nr:class I SAM-dependent methyltransferase [Planctomycetota bacterium]